MGFKSKFTKELKKKTKGGFGLLSKPVSGGWDVASDLIGSGVDKSGLDSLGSWGFNEVAKPVGNKLWDAMNYGGDLGTGIYTMGFTEPYVNEEGEYDIKDPFSLNFKSNLFKHQKIQRQLSKESDEDWGKFYKDGNFLKQLKAGFTDPDIGFLKASEAFKRTDKISPGVKMAMQLGLDPTMYIGPGAVGALGKGLAKVAPKLGARAAPKLTSAAVRLFGTGGTKATSRTARVGGGLLEGTGKYTPVVAIGAGVGTEISSKTDNPYDDLVGQFGGGMLAQGAVTFKSGAKARNRARIISDSQGDVFESKLRIAVEEKMSNKIASSELKRFLKSQGVTEDEIKWTYIDELINQKEIVTKDDVRKWLDDYQVDLVESYTGKQTMAKETDLIRTIDPEVYRQQGGVAIEDLPNPPPASYGLNIIARSENGMMIEKVRMNGKDQYNVSREINGDTVIWFDTPEEAKQYMASLTDIEEWKFNSRGGEYTVRYEPDEFDPDTFVFNVYDENGVPLMENFFTKEETLEYLGKISHEGGSIPPTYQHMVYPDASIIPDSYKEWVIRAPSRVGASEYTGGHYGAEGANVVVHARTDVRNGPNGERILFINEIQSDWHQMGQKAGYIGENPTKGRDKLAVDMDKKYNTDGFTRLKDAWVEQLEVFRSTYMRNDAVYEDAVQRYKDIEAALKQELYEKRSSGDPFSSDIIGSFMYEIKRLDPVEAGPFSKNWDELAIKRLVRHAAEQGYDRVEFPSGTMVDTIEGGPNQGRARFYDTRVKNTAKAVAKRLGLKEIDPATKGRGEVISVPNENTPIILTRESDGYDEILRTIQATRYLDDTRTSPRIPASNGQIELPAVTRIYTERISKALTDEEVQMLKDDLEAIKVSSGGAWEFAISQPSSGYAFEIPKEMRGKIVSTKQAMFLTNPYVKGFAEFSTEPHMTPISTEMPLKMRRDLMVAQFDPDAGDEIVFHGSAFGKLTEPEGDFAVTGDIRDALSGATGRAGMFGKNKKPNVYVAIAKKGAITENELTGTRKVLDTEKFIILGRLQDRHTKRYLADIRQKMRQQQGVKVEDMQPNEAFKEMQKTIDANLGGGGGKLPPRTSVLDSGEGKYKPKANELATPAEPQILGDLGDLEERAMALKTIDQHNPMFRQMRSIANFMAMKLQVNPSTMMSSVVGRLVVARQRNTMASEELIGIALQRLDKYTGLGGFRGMKARLNINDDGIMRNVGMAWEDVFTNPKRFANKLTDLQKEFISDVHQMLDDADLLLERHGLDTFPKNEDGTRWIPRVVKGAYGFEIKRPTNHKLNRMWEYATDGMENGIDYGDPRETMQAYLRFVYQDIVDKQFGDAMEKYTYNTKAFVTPEIRDKEASARAALMHARENYLTAKALEQASIDENASFIPTLDPAADPSLKATRIDLGKKLGLAAKDYAAARRSLLDADTEARKALENNKQFAPAELFGGIKGNKQQVRVFSVKGAGQRVVLPDDFELLTKYVGVAGMTPAEQTNAIASSANWIGKMFRRTTSTFDYAASFMHLLPVLATNPKAWSKAVAYQYTASMNPRALAGYTEKNRGIINEMAANDISYIGNEYFEELMSGRAAKAINKLTLGGAQKTRDQSIGRFQAGMEAALAVARTEIYKAHREAYAKNGNLEGLGQLVRNLTGGLDSRSLMIDRSHRNMESMFMAFSPRLMRSSIALVGMAMKPRTAEGRAAIKSLAIMTGLTAMLFYGFNKAIGRTDEEAWDSINPASGKKFLSIDTGDGYIGIGGQFRALAQVAWGSGTAIKNGDWEHLYSSDRFENPILAWYSGRGAPAVSFGQTLIEGLTGVNANPYEEINGYQDLGASLAKDFLPFTAQSYIEEGNLRNVLFEFNGLRTIPYNKTEERNVLIETEGYITSDGRQARSLDDLNKEQRSDFFEKYPVEQISNTDSITKYFDLIAQINDEYQKDVLKMESRVEAGLMSKPQFREWHTERKQEKFNKIDQTRTNFAAIPAERAGFEGSVTDYLKSKNTRPEDIAVDKWYSIFDEIETKSDGKPDYDEIEKARAKYLNSLPKSHRDYVIRATSRKGPVDEERLATEEEYAKDLVRPYFEADEEIFNYFKESGQFFKTFGSWDAFQQQVSKMASDMGLTFDDMLSIITKSNAEAKAFFTIRTEYKRLLQLQNPEMMRALAEWYDITPANRFDFIMSKYGLDASALNPAIAGDKSLNNRTRAQGFALQMAQSGLATQKRRFYRPTRSQQ